ncbi:MAG: hypothetical protein H6935_05275 [Thiobacillus sp.]|nr:hypothetical protein [Thiobacillus sp.]
MISPGSHHHHDDDHEQHAAKPDRWLVGLLAGAALIYLAGRVLGLGKAHRPNSPRNQTD